MQVNVTGVYTHEKSGAMVDCDKLPEKVVNIAVRRAFGHIFSNELTSKFPEKGVENMTEAQLAERSEKIAEWVASLTGKLYDGSWGDGARASRGPTINTFEGYFDKFLYAEVRKNLAKNGNTESDVEKDTFLNPKTGNYVPLAKWAEAFLKNPAKGDARRAELTKKAEAEMAKRAVTVDSGDAIDDVEE